MSTPQEQIADRLRRWGSDLREEAGETDSAARFVGLKLDGIADEVLALRGSTQAPREVARAALASIAADPGAEGPDRIAAARALLEFT